VAYHFEGMTKERVAPSDRNYALFIERWRGRCESEVAPLHLEAEAARYDLDQRVLSRRDLPKNDRLLQERTTELMRLRRPAGMRSVRAAVWLHGLVGRLVPARPR
jgi:hypothetical protein